jgi:hypothetical protein
MLFSTTWKHLSAQVSDLHTAILRELQYSSYSLQMAASALSLGRDSSMESCIRNSQGIRKDQILNIACRTVVLCEIVATCMRCLCAFSYVYADDDRAAEPYLHWIRKQISLNRSVARLDCSAGNYFS